VGDRPALQIAFATGGNEASRCALSPIETAFLHDLPFPHARKIFVNFPYDEATPPFRDRPLWRASLHNASVFVGTHVPRRAMRERSRVAALIDRAERTIFLAGSCGLQRLARLHLDAARLARIGIFAYGPVATRRAACRTVLVGSTRDPLSRAFVPRPTFMVACDHLAYLTDPAVHAHCIAFVAAIARA